MHLLLSLLLLAATALLTSSASLPHPTPGQPSECALSLVALSPCLAYIAGPPNEPAPAPSVICCGTFFEAVMTAGPTCVCYLVHDPLILGFPVDTGRLVSLFPSCGANDSASAVHWLYDTCRVTEIETMSPLPGIAPSPGSADGPSPAILCPRPLIGTEAGPGSAVNFSSDVLCAPTPVTVPVLPNQVGRMQFLWSFLTVWLVLSIEWIIR